LAAIKEEVQVSTTTRLVLRRFTQLGETEQWAIIRTMTAPQRFRRHCDLVSAGSALPSVYMVVSGVACRYITLYGGQRQILSYLFPGDVFDLRACLAQRVDCSVQSLSEVRATLIPGPEVIALTDRFPRLMRELWRLTAIEDAITRQWLLNVGRRSAVQRLSHLLCECFVRLSDAGAATGNSCPMPLTQADIADALALTPVHVNRTLTQLREAGLAVLRGHRLTILDRSALYAVAEFESAYLQIAAASPETPSARTTGFAGERYLREAPPAARSPPECV
jgi:CRP-like cAMP-binding protein